MAGDNLRNWSLGMRAYVHAATVAWICVFTSAAMASGALVLRNGERRALTSTSTVHVAGTDTSGPPTGESRPRSYVRQLPADISVEPVLHDLRRHAAAENVELASADANVVAPTVESLAQLHLLLVLRGRYTGIKATLGQVLARHTNLVVQRVQLQASAAPGDLEASVAVVLLGQPLATPSVGGERR